VAFVSTHLPPTCGESMGVTSPSLTGREKVTVIAVFVATFWAPDAGTVSLTASAPPWVEVVCAPARAGAAGPEPWWPAGCGGVLIAFTRRMMTATSTTTPAHPPVG
jgi:hypothetical protein